MSRIESRLASLGIELPQVCPPVANYVSATRSGNIVQVSGQLSTHANGGIKGTVGVDCSLADGIIAARLCAINLIAQFKAAADGDLDRVRVLRLGGYVQAGPEFFEIPAVMNGCSDLIVDVFGEAGKHARSAIGVYRLPFNFAVEVDASFEIVD
ncbi:RidA family protein [Sphingopyxis sp. USTB-05]|uniref:RidA family protein n=1 Tax=Sphingopyxis sp. USTB-05 TaxID=2830667 RepID=UPI002078F62F|nr:RidA family protein [Sphingopyxis sp. USTB-05]USI78617.1 RidA family protein [Sphingopyxis sp. USTB-05]